MAVACAVTGGVVMFPTAGVVWHAAQDASRTPTSTSASRRDQTRREPPGVQVHSDEQSS